jgi:hypothetical protein
MVEQLQSKIKEKIVGNTIVCPQCQLDDQIQKVSTIYNNGTSRKVGAKVATGTADFIDHGNTRDVSGNLSTSGVMQTNLSYLLSPPKKPAYPGLGWWWASIFLMYISYGFLIVPIAWLSPIAKSKKIQITVATLLLIFYAWLMFMLVENNLVPALLVEILGGIVAVGIVVWYGIALNSEKKRRVRELEIATPEWQERMKTWSELYYCYRNDCVFNPMTGNSVSPYDIKQLME